MILKFTSLVLKQFGAVSTIKFNYPCHRDNNKDPELLISWAVSFIKNDSLQQFEERKGDRPRRRHEIVMISSQCRSPFTSLSLYDSVQFFRRARARGRSLSLLLSRPREDQGNP